jgi:hypothetical protein
VARPRGGQRKIPLHRNRCFGYGLDLDIIGSVDPDPGRKKISSKHKKLNNFIPEEIDVFKLGAEYCNKTHRLDMEPKLDSPKRLDPNPLDMEPKLDSPKRLDPNPDSINIFPNSSAPTFKSSSCARRNRHQATVRGQILQ